MTTSVDIWAQNNSAEGKIMAPSIKKKTSLRGIHKKIHIIVRIENACFVPFLLV